MTAPDAPQVEPLRLTLEEARRRHDAAREELSRLCHGGRFRMTIPAQSDDSDVILGDALRALKALTEGHDLVPRDPAAELVEATTKYVEAVEAHEAYLERTYEVRDAAEADEAVERIGKWWGAMKAALARVKGGA